ncbi:putative lipoprotein [Yersinia pseudotuberculosis]|nr:Putative lipoprotein NMB1124/NMB1162 precursor [Yersinia pseudotuberculosis]SUP87498.1 putative lipoprotein [Yersinia pseudotuberculosis]
MKSIFAVCAVMMALLLTGCATPVVTDYTDFKQSKPKSILVLLPQNQSPEVDASHGVLSQVTYPLAEAGYYVLPVAVVEETFKQNGMTNAGDISAASPAKLRQIFGADAVLYITIVQYGTLYLDLFPHRIDDPRLIIGMSWVRLRVPVGLSLSPRLIPHGISHRLKGRTVSCASSTYFIRKVLAIYFIL